MAYKYEKVNQQLLVPQIEDQLLMYIQEKNIAIGSKLPSEYKLAELFGVGSKKRIWDLRDVDKEGCG